MLRHIIRITEKITIMMIGMMMAIFLMKMSSTNTDTESKAIQEVNLQKKSPEPKTAKRRESSSTYYYPENKRLSADQVEKYILSFDPLEAHIRLCQFKPAYCHVSADLLPEFYPYLNRLYLAIVKHESANFKYRRGRYDKDDLGLPQINIRFWSVHDLHNMGFEEVDYMWDLVEDDRLALKVGYVIFWHNIVYGFDSGNRPNAIYKYVSHYHSPGKYKKYYVKRVKNHLKWR